MDYDVFSLSTKIFSDFLWKFAKEYVNLEIKKSSAIPNGKILLSAKLSMALRWFAGGSSYDIALYHGVHYQETMKSVWTNLRAN